MLLGGEGGYSGVPTYLAQICAALAGRARLSVVSDENRGGYDFAARMGVAHHPVTGLQTGLSPRRAAAALRGLDRLIAAEAPDMIWAHARMAVLLVRVLALGRRLRGRAMPPLAITYHGLPFGPGHRQPFAALAGVLERLFLRACPPHHLLFLSPAAKARFATRVGAAAMARHRAHVLANCSDLGPVARRAAPGRAERVLVMTGRAGHQKNHAAAAALMAHLPENYHLVLCGGGTDSAAMRALFEHHLGARATAARLRFVGPVADVRPHLGAADLFLLTSRYEGMPIAALEAFEAGLPMALSDIPGTAEIRAAHPMACALPARDAAGAAAQVVALTEAWLRDPAANAARIRAAWAATFSPAIWQDALRALWAEMQRGDR